MLTAHRPQTCATLTAISYSAGRHRGSAPWAASRPPQVQRLANLFIADDGKGNLEAHDDGAAVALDADLLQLLARELAFEPELLHPMTRVVREGAAGAVEALTVLTIHYNEIADSEEIIDTRYFLRRQGQTWQPLSARLLKPGTVILDLFALDAGGRTLLVLTDAQGFQLTEDGGASWRDFNHGEAALLDGARVRAVAVGTPPSLYALVDRGSTNLSNPLFRHMRHSWADRLRIGLLGLLQPPAP